VGSSFMVEAGAREMPGFSSSSVAPPVTSRTTMLTLASGTEWRVSAARVAGGKVSAAAGVASSAASTMIGKRDAI